MTKNTLRTIERRTLDRPTAQEFNAASFALICDTEEQFLNEVDDLLQLSADHNPYYSVGQLIEVGRELTPPDIKLLAKFHLEFADSKDCAACSKAISEKYGFPMFWSKVGPNGSPITRVSCKDA